MQMSIIVDFTAPSSSSLLTLPYPPYPDDEWFFNFTAPETGFFDDGNYSNGTNFTFSPPPKYNTWQIVSISVIVSIICIITIGDL